MDCPVVSCLKSLFQVRNNIVDMLGSDGKTDRVRLDPLIEQFLRTKLGVCRAGRMDDQGFHIRHIGKQRENLEFVDEGFCSVRITFDFKGENRTGSVGVILLIQYMVGMAPECGMVHRFDLRVLREIVDHFERIGHMAFDAEGQRLKALQEQEGMERTDRCAGIPKQSHPDFHDVGEISDRLGEHHAMVARVRLGKPGEFVVRGPVEFAGIHDDAAYGGAMAADEFRRRMDDDVGAMFDWTEQVRGGERVVNKQRNAVLMRKCRNRVDVNDSGIRIAQGFNEDRLRIGLDGFAEILQIASIHKSGFDAEIRKRMGEKVVRAAVDALVGNDMVPRMRNILDGISHSRRAGRRRQGCDAAFESGDALFEHIRCRIHEPCVDVAAFGQSEPAGCLGGIRKDIGGGRIDRYRSCIGCGIGFFLSDMKLQGFKFVFLITHCKFLLSSI